MEAVKATVSTKNAISFATCLSKNSLKTYSSAWNSWLHFASFYEFNPLCLHSSGRTRSIETLVNRLKLYIGLECGVRQLSPDSIERVYLPGIAKHLDQMQIFSAFREATKHAQINCILGGYQREWHLHHSESDKVKIPFTLNLAILTDELLRQGTIQPPGVAASGPTERAGMERHRLITALWVGIFFLLRKSEFLPEAASFRRHHLRFQDANRHDIPYQLIGITKAYFVSITIEFSKADQTGKGRIIHHSRQKQHKDRCIVRRLEEYIARSRDIFGAQQSDLLFDIPTFPTLTTTMLASTMKLTCNVVNLPEDKVSAHSLRYGGASMMAAAGFPDYVIAYYGGWAPGSKAMQRYIHPSDDIIQTVSQHMASVHSSKSVDTIVHGLMANRIPRELQQHRKRTRT